MNTVRPDLAGVPPGLPGLLSQIGHGATAGDGPVVTANVAAADLEAAVRRLAAYPGLLVVATSAAQIQGFWGVAWR